MFQGRPQYTQIATINMHLFIKIRHNNHLQFHGYYVCNKQFNIGYAFVNLCAILNGYCYCDVYCLCAIDLVWFVSIGGSTCHYCNAIVIS